MPLVATLISSPRTHAVTQAVANRAAATVQASETRWLADQVALDLDLPGTLSAADARSRLADAIGDAPVDIIVQERDGRRKRMLIADMDSTMIDQECIDELADEVGLKAHVAAITARSMNGEIAFEPALRERVALLNGLRASVIDALIDRRITVASGAYELVRTMRANNAWTALVSGGFTAFTGPIASKIGFDENRANILNTDGDLLAGTVAEPILGRAAKATALREIALRLGIGADDVIAVGDGANDLDMLAIAGAGVALHAKPAVAAAAGMRVDHGDLTALLYIQGYRQDEFVT